MIVQSLKLGQLEMPEDKIIKMVKPILGFEHLSNFCLVEVEELKPFLWFQSIDDSAVSFLVANPILFKSDYIIEINSKEVAELMIKKSEAVETYVILSFHENSEQMSANLQGPILINTENNLAKQMILVNSGYEVKYLLYDQEDESAETDLEIKNTAVEV